MSVEIAVLIVLKVNLSQAVSIDVTKNSLICEFDIIRNA